MTKEGKALRSSREVVSMLCLDLLEGLQLFSFCSRFLLSDHLEHQAAVLAGPRMLFAWVR